MSRDAKGRNFGHLKLVNCYGLKLVVSPDAVMWIMPTGITLALFLGALYIAGRQPLTRWNFLSSSSPASSSSPMKKYSPQYQHSPLTMQDISFIGVCDLVGTMFIVCAALFFSLLCGLTDPGAIPRVEPEQQQPQQHEQQQYTPAEIAEFRRQDLFNKQTNSTLSPTATTIVNINTTSKTTPTAVAQDDDEESSKNNDKDQLLVHVLRLGHEATVSASSLGTTDPYSDMTNWTFCRVCNLRRPPRAAHCYTCGVCVLSNDHHCGVVGGDVSLRSLRWFVLYLQCVGIAALNTMTWILGGLFDTKNRANPGSMALHITLLVFVGNIVLMVGGLACFYTWMALTDLTRRESQGKNNSSKSQGKSNVCYYHEHMNQAWQDQSTKWFGNVKRILYPPPSLIAWEE